MIRRGNVMSMDNNMIHILVDVKLDKENRSRREEKENESLGKRSLGAAFYVHSNCSCSHNEPTQHTQTTSSPRAFNSSMALMSNGKLRAMI
jgi:hypothetical protein